MYEDKRDPLPNQSHDEKAATLAKTSYSDYLTKICGYGADVDPTAVGLSVLAFTWVRQAPGTVATDLTPDFAAIPEIEECHHIAGEADYLLKIRARDMEHLGAIVRRIQTTPDVFSTETDVVFSTGFEGRPLSLTTKGGEAPETRRPGSA